MIVTAPTDAWPRSDRRLTDRIDARTLCHLLTHWLAVVVSDEEYSRLISKLVEAFARCDACELAPAQSVAFVTEAAVNLLLLELHAARMSERPAPPRELPKGCGPAISLP